MLSIYSLFFGFQTANEEDLIVNYITEFPKIQHKQFHNRVSQPSTLIGVSDHTTQGGTSVISPWTEDQVWYGWSPNKLMNSIMHQSSFGF